MKYLNTRPPSLLRTVSVLGGFACILLVYVAFGRFGSHEDSSTTKPGALWPVSCFVYRDDNRNGLFDVADRPYAGLAVEIERPDGSIARNRSNVAGFANFNLAKDIPGDTNLYEIGSYKVSASAPKGWKITSNMESNQALLTVGDSHVGGRMILNPPCEHIGVSADMSISGEINTVNGLTADDLVATASIAGGEALTLSLDENGGYQFPATPGIWTLEAYNKQTGERVSRTLEVRSTGAVLSEISFGAKPFEQKVSVAETISFAELTSSETLYEIPSGYHGLHWQYWVATHIKFYNGYGYVNGAMSDEYMAYNSSGFPASFSSDEPFDFVGAYLTAAWPRAEEDFVTVKAWRDGEVKHEDQISITPAGPVYFAADYLSVEKVEFVMGNRERIVIDDVLIRR